MSTENQIFGSIEHGVKIPGSDPALLQQFENLGDNCELGLVQRYGGVERASLLRFNYTDIHKLIRGLKNGFADLALPGQVVVEWTDEWMVKETVYGFSYHTFNTDPNYDRMRLVKEQERWLRYMAEKFLEDLQIGDRIYVRKGESNEDADAIRALSEALRSHGPATLLWVTQTDATHDAGTVEWVGDAIVRAWIDGFAPYSRAFDVETSHWLRILRATWALINLKNPAAFPVQERATLLAADFGGWAGSSIATNDFDWTIPRNSPDDIVMRHVLLRDVSPPREIFGCLMTSKVRPAHSYVALADVWLPADFTGDHVCLVFIGRPSVAIRRAVKSKRNVWQTIWVSTTLGDGDKRAFPSLELVGPTGTVLYSKDWRLYEGLLPPA